MIQVKKRHCYGVIGALTICPKSDLATVFWADGGPLVTVIQYGGGKGHDGGRICVSHVDIVVLWRGQPRAALAKASEAILKVGLRNLGLAFFETPGAG